MRLFAAIFTLALFVLVTVVSGAISEAELFASHMAVMFFVWALCIVFGAVDLLRKRRAARRMANKRKHRIVFFADQPITDLPGYQWTAAESRRRLKEQIELGRVWMSNPEALADELKKYRRP